MRPAYQSLYELALCVGCVVHYWDCKRDASGALKFDVSTLLLVFVSGIVPFSPNLPQLAFSSFPTTSILLLANKILMQIG